MPSYRSYMHVEKLGRDEVLNIELGNCHIFPKLDGTNASVWLDDNGEVRAGSRTRQLSLESDNAGFYAYVLTNDKIKAYLQKHPDHRLYGEWLVPHTLNTYRADAWRRFWIFDVAKVIDTDMEEYIPYDIYAPMLEEFGLDYIIPAATITNATYDWLIGFLDRNTFLIEDGKGVGEGIVIKNYNYYNQQNRQIWAKLVRQEFKEQNSKAFGTPEVKLSTPVEQDIIDQFLTESLIEKVYAKIVNEEGAWNNKFIPRLFQTCYYDLIREDMWEILKTFKDPQINFKTLRAMCIAKIKTVKKNLF